MSQVFSAGTDMREPRSPQHRRGSADSSAVSDAVRLAARIAADSPAAVSATLRAIHAATAELDSQGWLATDRAGAKVEAPRSERGHRRILRDVCGAQVAAALIGCPLRRAGQPWRRQGAEAGASERLQRR